MKLVLFWLAHQHFEPFRTFQIKWICLEPGSHLDPKIAGFPWPEVWTECCVYCAIPSIDDAFIITTVPVETGGNPSLLDDTKVIRVLPRICSRTRAELVAYKTSAAASVQLRLIRLSNSISASQDNPQSSLWTFFIGTTWYFVKQMTDREVLDHLEYGNIASSKRRCWWILLLGKNS